MPNDNTNPPTKIKTFYKLPDLDARIAVYERLGMLWFSFLAQGCSPDGTKRNPDHRKAQKALIPQLHKFMGCALVVRYGKRSIPCEHFVDDVEDVLALARKGGNYRLDLAFNTFDDPTIDWIAVLVLDLVPVKNRPVKPAEV